MSENLGAWTGGGHRRGLAGVGGVDRGRCYQMVSATDGLWVTLLYCAVLYFLYNFVAPVVFRCVYFQDACIIREVTEWNV